MRHHITDYLSHSLGIKGSVLPLQRKINGPQLLLYLSNNAALSVRKFEQASVFQLRKSELNSLGMRILKFHWSPLFQSQEIEGFIFPPNWHGCTLALIIIALDDLFQRLLLFSPIINFLGTSRDFITEVPMVASL